uniref:Uncharacterized protein n=1 Tax=Biomphalaria glabrata TaxID=6526 RepID=A0A2C9KTW7_BIOGL
MDTGRQASEVPIRPVRSYTQYNGFSMPVTFLDGSYLTATSYGQEGEATLRGTKPVSRARPQQFENTSLPQLSPRHQVTTHYVHNHGVFTSTMPRITGNYVIHPDWVSEKPRLRRTRSLRQL